MQNRRKFLKNSLLAATGAGLASKTNAQTTHISFNDDEKKKFVYRTLGKTGIDIPIVSMGTGNTENPNLVKEALNKGVKLVATHQAYKNGNNEIMVGNGIKDFSRDSFLIMTGTNEGLEIDYTNGIFKPESNTEIYIEGANGCLKRLQVDYVDIFSLGFAARRESVFFEPLLKAMEKIKKQGKARFLAVATHKFEAEAIRAAADTGIYDVVMTAYNFKHNDIDNINEALEYATGKGLGIIAMKTMAGVYWDREKTKPINTKAALKWALQNENIHTTVPDCSNYDHLEQDLAIMSDLTLTEAEKKDLKPPSEGLSSGLYCQQCNQCIPQCPANLDIPTIMRSYMYAYGYKNLAHARETLCTSGLNAVSCESCNECQVTCQVGFDIKKKILDIARLKDVPEDLIRHG